MPGTLATALIGVCAGLLALAPVTAASPGSGPTAVVTIGDSYISGEAGRWAGNSISLLPGHDGTDRGRSAYVDGTDATGCHRSDVAQVLIASLPVDERVNLACSGADTPNVMRAAGGGRPEKGEPPQADRLLSLAVEKDVQLVLVSIGGNDAGFAPIVTACVFSYVERRGPCEPEQQPRIDAAIPKAFAGVRRVVRDIRAVMAQAGYARTDYRLVLQTYPSVVPRSAEARHPEGSPLRELEGCPFYDSDLDWMRDEAGGQIGAMVKRAARSRGAEWLDVGDLFQGHEICATGARQSTPVDRPPESRAEWGRMVSASSLAQGELQELFHPNAFGQRALGACLTQLYAMRLPGTFACTGTAGTDPGAVALRRASTLTVGQRPALRLRATSVRRVGRRACGRFSVTAAGRPVRGAVVRFAGRRAATGRRGRAVVCGPVHGARARATARKPGHRPARRWIAVPRR